ncbi:MAG: GAP family protein [Solirubrobacterales bacterium]
MTELLTEILPLVLAAAVNPATIGIVVLVLATAERPLMRAGAFAAGFAFLLVAASAAGLIALTRIGGGVDAGSPALGWVDIGMAAVCLVSAAVSLTRQGDIAAQQERLRGAPLPAFFGLGMVMMLSSLNSLAVSVSLLHRIAAADVSGAERALALAFADTVILIPVLAPIALAVLAPGLAGSVLPRVRAGVDRYGVRVGAAVFVAIGIYLIAEGIQRV